MFLDEYICWKMTRFAHGRRLSRPASQRSESREAYFDWQYETTADQFRRYMNHLDLTGKTLLDLGCGMGGRSNYLAARGPERVIAVDIDAGAVETAKEYTARKFPDVADRIDYRVSPDGRIPVDDASVDVIILFDVFEHLEDPNVVLDECARVLRPGGRLWFGTIGWYNYRASHLDHFIPIPWCQVMFSDQTLIRTIVRITESPDYEPTVWDRENNVSGRWKSARDLSERPGEYLNKITLRRARGILDQRDDFDVERFTVHGFTGSRLPAMRALNLLTRIRGLDELFHSYLSVTLLRR